jgi:hypothetical protein
VVVGISRVSQYRLVAVSGGASAVGLYRRHVSIPVCVMVHGRQGVNDIAVCIRSIGIWYSGLEAVLNGTVSGGCGAVSVFSFIPVCYARVVVYSGLVRSSKLSSLQPCDALIAVASLWSGPGCS